jgi:hypothetical protein
MILPLTVLLCTNHTLGSASEIVTQSSEEYNMYINVAILDIDQKTLRAYVNLSIDLGPLPYAFNETEVTVLVLGGGFVMLHCSYYRADSFGKYFQGNCSTPWDLFGFGEFFPFDYYLMNFTIKPLIDADFRMKQVEAFFYGLKQRDLMDTWETLPGTNVLRYCICEDEKSTLMILIKRKPLVPFLAFVLPIILCCYILAASLFLDSESKMSEILTVYLSLFVFAPTFFIGIQDFLPHKSLLTIPEILLTNLITSTGILGFFVIISGFWKIIIIRNFEVPVEWFGIFIVLLFFTAYYLWLWFELPFSTFSPIETALVFVSIVLSYFVGVAGFLLRLRKRKSKPGKDQTILIRY